MQVATVSQHVEVYLNSDLADLASVVRVPGHAGNTTAQLAAAVRRTPSEVVPDCRGLEVHVVTGGDLGSVQDTDRRALMTALLDSCGGKLVTWTPLVVQRRG